MDQSNIECFGSDLELKLHNLLNLKDESENFLYSLKEDDKNIARCELLIRENDTYSTYVKLFKYLYNNLSYQCKYIQK